MKAALRFVTPGLASTIQDLGRPGFRSVGIPAGGALDGMGLRAANILVGNPPEAAAIEIAYVGPSFVVEAHSVRIAFFGADASIEVFPNEDAIDGECIPAGRSMLLHRGQFVRVGSLKRSAVMYMAAEGGLDIAAVMGSQSTYARGAMGGFCGRALAAGDVLTLVNEQADCRPESQLALPDNWIAHTIRVVDGPQRGHMTDEAADCFFRSAYMISGADRMGMRLGGPTLAHTDGFNIVSDAIAPGSIQLPGNGLPIVLLRDHQTVGGYPKIAVVISADLSALGRIPVGSLISFERVSLEAAQEALRETIDEAKQLPLRLKRVDADIENLAARLIATNLISGIVSAHGFA